jgi:hypothetical protein
MEIEKETCRTSLKTLRFLSYTRRTSEKNVVGYDPLLAILPQEAEGLRKQSYLTGREHVVVTMLTRRSGEWLDTRLDIRLTRDHGYLKLQHICHLRHTLLVKQSRVRSQHTWFTDLTECMPMLSWKRGMQISHNLNPSSTPSLLSGSCASAQRSRILSIMSLTNAHINLHSKRNSQWRASSSQRNISNPYNLAVPPKYHRRSTNTSIASSDRPARPGLTTISSTDTLQIPTVPKKAVTVSEKRSARTLAQAN